MKNLYTLLAILISFYANSQDNSVAASVLTPTAYQTGVPDISFPLAELPATKDFNISYSLSYNPNAFRMGEYSGQVARNWALSGGNFTITRLKVSGLDESMPPTANDWNDIYYYTLNGEQGSFKFEKVGTYPNDTYHIVKLTPSNIIIEFERETIAVHRKPVKSFTITDSKGYRYYFLEHDYYKLPGDQGLDMRNTFYITKILDAKNRQVVTYTNKKYTRYDEHNPSQVEGWVYLPEKVQTDYGSIILEHGDSGYLFEFHDKYFFSGFTLKDHKDNFISKYIISVDYPIYQFYDLHDEYDEFPETRAFRTRNLSSITRLDKNAATLDKTKFEYEFHPTNIYGPSPSVWSDFLAYRGVFRDDNPNSLMYGVLKTVILPTGAKIDYQFRVNKLKYSVDKNTPSYIQRMQDPFDFSDPDIQYLELVNTIDFDTEDSRIHYITGLTHSPNSRIYIQFIRNEIYPWETGYDPEDGGEPGGSGGPGGPPPKLAYKVRNTVPGGGNTYWYDQEIEDEYSRFYVIPSNGSAYIELLGSGGNGTIYIFEKHYTSPPYINERTLPNSGVRIEKITYHSRGDNFTPMYPSYAPNPKTIEYDYSLFDEPGISSGVVVADDQKEAIIYKNIKVTESDKGGYTKYYYKTPLDFPTYPHPTIPNRKVWPNYNLMKKGLSDKQEVYDKNNLMKHSTIFGYTFPAYDPNEIYNYEIQCENCDYASIGGIYTEEKFAEKIRTEDFEYDAQGNSMKVTVERIFNLQNNNLMSEKKTTADGTVSEVTYQYAQEKNNTKLLNANMISVPLEVTQKQNNVETGKVEMKFDHTDNYFPSSVKKFGINSSVKAEEKNDIYDTMGNVLQTTTKTGIPTTFIYGYSGTLLIAKIEGATYAQVMQAYGLPSNAEAYKSLEIYTRSNLDIDAATEETFRQKLDLFRLNSNFKDYQITTYTYDPLIGIKSVTSPSGNKEYYYYDNANRLIRVEDINHNVIKENKYDQYVLE